MEVSCQKGGSSDKPQDNTEIHAQHDGVQAHSPLSVRNVLNGHFPSRWIGRGSPTSPAPLPWPPHSPDLAPQTIRCGMLTREERLRVATSPTKICAELRKTPFAQLLQKCSDVCHRGLGGASACVSCIKVQLRIHWASNQDIRKLFK
ncbi:hypothetical protein Cfor_03630 [Coptotermes formosanus]|uniref:Uncharacterized protein n=1 Tax=Coptotermes formosanus TaxID=36987 RepID=A0A6L2PD50_COPFO|nr:hypothetical protein Cfor_03630 [Coptotermes formosanus]